MKFSWLCLVLAVAACGEVSKSNHDSGADDDAGSGNDSATDDGGTPVAPSSVSLRNIMSVEIPASQFKKVPFTDEAYDTNNEYDTTTSTFTPLEDGDYLVCSTFRTNSGVTTTLATFVDNVQGTAFAQAPSIGANGCTIVTLHAGQALDVRVFNNDEEAAIDVTPGDFYYWLTIDRVDMIVAATALTYTVPANVPTLVPFGNESKDTENAWNPQASAFVTPSAGDYLFCASTQLNNSVELSLYKNSAKYISFGYGDGTSQGCRALHLAVGDLVTVQVTDSSAVSNHVSTPSFDWLRIARVSGSVEERNMDVITVNDNVPVKMPFKDEVFDAGNEYDLTTSTFKPTMAGVYLVCAGATLGAVPAYIDLNIYLDGVREKALSLRRVSAPGCRPVRLAANQPLEVWIRQAAFMGTSYSVGNNTTWNWLHISKLH